jgi:protoheme IX farnesyltransferase
MKQPTENALAYLELCKLRISTFAAFSSACGFLLSAPGFGKQILLLVLGVFTLASGAGALNQYQERTTDALMLRTEKRPIPSGRIGPLHALCFAVILIFSGSSAIFLVGGMTASLLGLFAVLWYNGIYTYLKRKTAFAAIPGALVGAIPPAIGSIAGGGSHGDPGVLFLCFFFFLWQVPHFWLLFINHGEEYRRAGLPSLTGTFTDIQLSRVIFNWIIATAVSCLFIAATGAGVSPVTHFFLFGASLWLIWNGLKLLRKRGKDSAYAFAFKRINLYMLLVMTLLSIDKLFG